MSFLKFWTKKAKETGSSDEGFKIFLDFDLKTFRFLPIELFTKCDELTRMLMADLLKSGPLCVSGHEIREISEFPLKKYSAIFLVLRVHQASNIINQRKLNFYECPLELLQDKDKSLDYNFVFSLNESLLNPPTQPPEKRYSKRGSGLGKIKTAPKKKKKGEINKTEEIREGMLKKKNKKGEFAEKFFVLYKDKLLYYKPKEIEKKKEIGLSFARLEKLPDLKEKSNVFEIKTLNKSYFLQTSSNLNNWMNDIKFQISVSTDNKILSEYDAYIKQRESKNLAFLQDNIEKIASDFISHLKSPIFRSWFLAFFTENHPKKSALMSFIDLFYRSKDNRELVEDVKRVETTLIFINLLYEIVEKALRGAESAYKMPQTIADPVSGEFLQVVTLELWSKLQARSKELSDSIDPPDDLVNEIYGLLTLVNEKFVQHSKLYFPDFFESELFKRRFSHNYMRKSCQHFLFQKPQIKMEIHKLEKPTNTGINYLSPKVPLQRERLLTGGNPGKNHKESGDATAAQSCLSKSLNLPNEGL